MKGSKWFIVLSCCLLLFSTQCDDEDDLIVDQHFCDNAEVMIDNELYLNAETDFFNLAVVEVNGDCLYIDYSASGCDGSSWQMALIDSGDIAESFPPQRSLKLMLVNEEACQAVFGKSQYFDLTLLRVVNTNEVLLNIEGWSEQLTYTY